MPPEGSKVGMGGGILGASKDRSDLRLARASPLRDLVSGTTSGDVWPPLWGTMGYPATREGTPELPFRRGDGGGKRTRRDGEGDLACFPSMSKEAEAIDGDEGARHGDEGRGGGLKAAGVPRAQGVGLGLEGGMEVRGLSTAIGASACVLLC